MNVHTVVNKTQFLLNFSISGLVVEVECTEALYYANQILQKSGILLILLVSENMTHYYYVVKMWLGSLLRHGRVNGDRDWPLCQAGSKKCHVSRSATLASRVYRN